MTNKDPSFTYTEEQQPKPTAFAQAMSVAVQQTLADVPMDVLKEIKPETTVEEPKEPKLGLNLDEDKGVIRTPSGLSLPFERSTDTSLYIERLKLLTQSMSNRPPLPTQILFPNQKKEAMELVEKYVEGIRANLAIMSMYGASLSIESYAFRLPHMINEADWVNIVVRLQFASSLYAIYETLNQNLSKDATSKWGVLELIDGKYQINGREIKFGDRIDVFTTSEKLLSNVQFNSQEILNCRPIQGNTLPVFTIPLEELRNIDADAMQKRKDSGMKDKQHLMGTDAWSFLHGLLYRISDDEDVIEIETSILSKEDRDPEVNQRLYNDIGNKLQEEDLPYGLNHALIVGLRDYYCKNERVFNGFVENVKAIYADPEKFRKNLLTEAISSSFVIENIHALTFLLDGKSKLLRVKLIMMDGTYRDAVTITRPLNMVNLGTFARFNARPLYFQEIKYIRKENRNRGFIARLRGTEKLAPIDGDKFELVDADPIQSENVLGMLVGSAKAYYFDEESSLEKDDKFRFFHQLRKSFKEFDSLTKK